MESLTERISKTANITEDQAKTSIDLVIAELKQKFPSALHGEIDTVIAGGKFGDNIRVKLEELKEKVGEAARHAGEKAEIAFNEAKEKLNDFFKGNKK